MKHKFIFSFFIFMVSLFVFISPLFANGAADYYGVTVVKLELYNGTSWITVFTGASSELDIASVSAGESCGNFVSGIAVPDGTYTHFRATPSPIFKIRGTDGAGNYTTAVIGDYGGSAMTTDINLKDICTVILTGAGVPTAQTKDFSATPITVTNGVVSHRIRLSFDVSTAVQLIDGELWPAVPIITMTVLQ